MQTTNGQESPDTVHGRLKEAVHIAGYSWSRAVDEFRWLLDDDRWQRVGAVATARARLA